MDCMEALDPESVAIDEAVCDEKVSDHSFDTILHKLLNIYGAIEKKDK